MKYTATEMRLVEEARENRGFLSAMWVSGTGPKGGRVSVGKRRYDTLNLMVLEHKAEVVLRFRKIPDAELVMGKDPLWLEAYGLMVKMKRIKKDKGKGYVPKTRVIQSAAMATAGPHYLDRIRRG